MAHAASRAGARCVATTARVLQHAGRVVAFVALDHLFSVGAQIGAVVHAGAAAVGHGDAGAFVGCHLRTAHNMSRTVAVMTAPVVAPALKPSV